MNNTKYIRCVECGWVYFVVKGASNTAQRFNHTCKKFREVSVEELDQDKKLLCVTITALDPDDIIVDEPMID